MSRNPMSKNPMSRQNEWIERMIQRAEADEPVYITDVREAFDRYGERALHIHAFLYEGGRERFPLSLPEWENDRQRSFTAEYVRAFLYNLLSTLGALKIEIYLDTEDGELVSLAEGLEGKKNARVTARA